MKTKISDIRNGKSCVKLETVEQFIKCFGDPNDTGYFYKNEYHGLDKDGGCAFLYDFELSKLYPLDSQRCDFSDIDW